MRPTLNQSVPTLTLQAQNLSYAYDRQPVVDQLSLQLHQGEILGLLGRNGAGKSTTIRLLSGCLHPACGSIQICGLDMEKQPVLARSKIGYLPDTPPLYRDLSVNDYLYYCARLHRVKADALSNAVETALNRCDLQSVRHRLIRHLSKGFQQRIGIAQAIVHNPEVIILDEPTVGLDPTQIRDIRQLISLLGQEHSVILSTHILSEIEAICDHVAIIQQGKIIHQSPCDHLSSADLETTFMRLTDPDSTTGGEQP